MTANRQTPRGLVLLAVGALGVSCVMTQLALMRELLAAFSGNEMVLGVTLGVWLLWMGIGAGLGRTSDMLRNPLMILFLLEVLVALLPLAQVAGLRALRNVVFIRGAEVGINGTIVSVVILLMPYCVTAGYALTLACSVLNRPGDPAGAGRVYAADSLGSIAGGVLFSFVLVRIFDHLALLAVPAVLNLLIAGAMGFHCGRKALGTVALALGLAVSWVMVQINVDRLSTAWLFWKQHVVTDANSPYGKLVVTEADGQFSFIENGVPLTSTRDDQHVEETVHYAMIQRPAARRVLLVGGGITGTAREILKYNVDRVDYVELDPLLLRLGRKYLPGNLADERVRVINTDGRLFIKQSAEKYDVVIVDVPDPSTAQLNRFYTTEFLAEVKRVLAPDGVVSFSLGHYENYISPQLARLLASARRSLAPAFAHVLMIPGGQVFFVASDGPLYGDIAARLEQQQVQTKLVNRHYLEAMLTPDRMADIERAVTVPAAINRDFSPMLYFYHLRHWLSQFNTGFGRVTAILLVGFGVYLVRLRGPALVLFASGFAGSALELVLLLAFQVVCGSVYHQVGIIVTVFMAGLALGALMANRRLVALVSKPAASSTSKSPEHGIIEGIQNLQASARLETRDAADLEVCAAKTQATTPATSSLALLAFAVAGFAVLLPFLLPLLNRPDGAAVSLFSIKAIVAVLTLMLAVLVGMQFPLANRLEYNGSVTGASRLYTADFVGAALGALLAGIWLIPLLGVTGVCLLTAGLNVLGGVLMQFRKAAI